MEPCTNVFQYLSIEFACFLYRNMYTCIPTALFNTYLHIPVFPFFGIAVFPHSSISSLPHFHTIGHSARQVAWFSQAMRHSPSRGLSLNRRQSKRGIPPVAYLALFALPWSGKGMKISKRYALADILLVTSYYQLHSGKQSASHKQRNGWQQQTLGCMAFTP